MDQVFGSEELECAGKLLQEVMDNNPIKTPDSRSWILSYHLQSHEIPVQVVSLLDEKRQIAQGAELHDDMDIGRGLLAINHCRDMGVLEAL